MDRKVKGDVVQTGLLRTLLAIKLRMLEYKYPTYEAFAEATGLTHASLRVLLNAKSNPTLATIETLAKNLGMDVFELFNLTRQSGFNLKHFDKRVSLREIKKALSKGPDVDLDKLKGGKRPNQRARWRKAKKVKLR